VHGDHCGGAEALRRTTGAKVYAGEGDADVLRAGGPRDAFFSTYDMPNHSPHPTTVDVPLKGDEVISFGDVRFRAIATPGHTPGSICYLMERSDLRALFSGDVILMLRGDENTRDEYRKPLGTYSAYLAPRYRGNADDYLASLRRLRAMGVPDLVLPGHPGADPTPESPALSTRRWHQILDQGIREQRLLVSRYRRDGAPFLDGSPRRLLPDLYYLGDLEDAAVYGFFAGPKLYLVNAPGNRGLADFLELQLARLGLKPARPAAILLTSCDAEVTGGLSELVERYQCEVVAGDPAVAKLRASLPSGTIVRSASELPDLHWFAVTPILLGGRGVGSVAYEFRWADQTVLMSGRIPIKVNRSNGTRLVGDFLSGRGNASDYLESLSRLNKCRPDLWLPAGPTEGQNARLYDQQWHDIINENMTLLQTNAELLKPRAR
jgi:glyoxylase-like metal-dependent hydrolase (beta-lactamase superfamily II)